MPKHYIEDDMRLRIQKMEIGDKFTSKTRVVTRTDLELFALLGGILRLFFLILQLQRIMDGKISWFRDYVPLTSVTGYSYRPGLSLMLSPIWAPVTCNSWPRYILATVSVWKPR